MSSHPNLNQILTCWFTHVDTFTNCACTGRWMCTTAPPAQFVPFQQLVGSLQWVIWHTHPAFMQPGVSLSRIGSCYVVIWSPLRVCSSVRTPWGLQDFKGGLEAILHVHQARFTRCLDYDRAMRRLQGCYILSILCTRVRTWFPGIHILSLLLQLPPTRFSMLLCRTPTRAVSSRITLLGSLYGGSRPWPWMYIIRERC